MTEDEKMQVEMALTKTVMVLVGLRSDEDDKESAAVFSEVIEDCRVALCALHGITPETTQ